MSTDTTGTTLYPLHTRTVLLKAIRGDTVTVPFDAAQEERERWALIANRGLDSPRTDVPTPSWGWSSVSCGSSEGLVWTVRLIP